VARPLRFRHAPGTWSLDRVRREVYGPLDDNLGARIGSPWYAPPEGYEARRFDVDNGDTALFCWNDDEAYWLGNTETPASLWRTDKVGLAAAPPAVTAWAEREVLAELLEDEPWLEAYPTLARFFLPVLCSKDGADSTRAFLRDHACGFPDADANDALTFYDATLARGLFDGDRETMAAKLGTSDSVDRGRMAATMGEFDAARLLDDAGHGFSPEAAVDGGYSLDYRTDSGRLVEVPSPRRPTGRRPRRRPARDGERESRRPAGRPRRRGRPVRRLHLLPRRRLGPGRGRAPRTRPPTRRRLPLPALRPARRVRRRRPRPRGRPAPRLTASRMRRPGGLRP